jgi:predicted restriction endonuclease
MDLYGPEGDRSKSDHISRLKYLAKQGFNIDSNLPENEIIVSHLKETAPTRNEYTDDKGYSNLGSALNRYRDFILSDIPLLIDLKNINESNIEITEKDALIKARLGQGKFRNDLFKLWHGCAVTGLRSTEFLIASHILPWYKSNNSERLNPYNGLLLQPNFDKLFDKGYISFEDDGHIILSKKLDKGVFDAMGIKDTNKLVKVFPENKPFLKKHREIFREILMV